MPEDLERVYKADDCVAFRRTNEPFGGLSNMAPSYRIRVNGVLFLTSEALYQACRFPDSPHLQSFIIAQTSPMTMKMKLKKVLHESRPDWDSIRVSVMRWCLRVKLSQNLNRFGDLLLETGDKPIVEDSRKDSFWGAIRCADDTFRGANVLGRLLMKLREDFRNLGPQEFASVEPPNIARNFLLGRPIGDASATSTQDMRSSDDIRRPSVHKDAQFRLVERRVDLAFASDLTSLLESLAKDGLDMYAKLEFRSKGGLSSSALSEIERAFARLGLEKQTTIIGQGTFKF